MASDDAAAANDTEYDPSFRTHSTFQTLHSTSPPGSQYTPAAAAARQAHRRSLLHLSFHTMHLFTSHLLSHINLSCSSSAGCLTTFSYWLPRLWITHWHPPFHIQAGLSTTTPTNFSVPARPPGSEPRHPAPDARSTPASIPTRPSGSVWPIPTRSHSSFPTAHYRLPRHLPSYSSTLSDITLPTSSFLLSFSSHNNDNSQGSVTHAAAC